MRSYFGNVERAKVTLRHEIEMRFNLIRIFTRKIFCYGAAKVFAFDFCLLVI